MSTNGRDERTGTTTVEVEGKVYRLTPDFNALCELQAITGKHPIDVMTLATAEVAEDGTITRAPDLSMVRACVWAYLQDAHADEIKTLKDAGRWIHRAGGVEVVDRALARLASLNAEDEPAAEGAIAGDPTGAPVANGTGAISSSMRSGSV